MPCWLLVQRGSILSQSAGWTLRFPVSTWSILPLRLLACSPFDKQSATSSCFSATILLMPGIYQAAEGYKIMVFVIPRWCSLFYITKFILHNAINILPNYYSSGYNVLFMLITIWWPTGSPDNTYLVTFETVFFKLICASVLSDWGHWPML